MESLHVDSRFIKYLSKWFGEPGWLLARSSIAEEAQIPSTVSVSDYIQIVSNVVRHGPDPAYHITLIEKGLPTYAGGLDLGIRSAPNLFAALELLVRFEPLRRKYDRLTFRVSQSIASIEFEPLLDLGAARAVLVETPFIRIYQMLATCPDFRADSVRVSFCNRPPKHIDRLRGMLDCDLAFGQEADRIEFPSRMLTTENPAYDAGLWRHALTRCEAEYGDGSQSFAGEVRALALLYLDEHSQIPKLEEIARRIGKSKRSVIRSLGHEGASYQSISNQIIMERATSLLRVGNLPLSRIAEQLGYSDVSSFHRAFRRTCGVSPSAFRAGASRT